MKGKTAKRKESEGEKGREEKNEEGKVWKRTMKIRGKERGEECRQRDAKRRYMEGKRAKRKEWEGEKGREEKNGEGKVWKRTLKVREKGERNVERVMENEESWRVSKRKGKSGRERGEGEQRTEKRKCGRGC